VSRYNGLGNSADRYVGGESFVSYQDAMDFIVIAYDTTTGEEVWVSRYNDENYSRDYAIAMTSDDDGNVYVTGESFGTYGHMGYATVAFDSSGNRLWATATPQPWGYSGGRSTAIAADGKGNVYVSGFFGYGNNQYVSYITIAYNSSGTVLWEKFFQGQAFDITTDNTSNIYVTGVTNGGYGTIAYDSSGNQLWVSIYASQAEPWAITTDKVGSNVYVTGKSATVAYDSDGNELWAVPGDPYYWSIFREISTDIDNNVYVTGYDIKDRKNVTIKYSQGIRNQPPSAEAGINRTTECAGTYGAAFALDGSGSSDPDGDLLTYTWAGPFGTKTGETTTVTLPLGTHTVTLTVDDGKGGTASDTVELTVEDTTPPVVTKATLSGNELLDGLYLSDVLLEMEATDTCSGVANIGYTLDGNQAVVQGSSASMTISSGGDHAITYNALDNAGNVSVG